MAFRFANARPITRLPRRKESNEARRLGRYNCPTQPSDVARRNQPVAQSNGTHNEGRRRKHQRFPNCSRDWRRRMLGNCDTLDIRTERNARIERQKFPQSCPKITRLKEASATFLPVVE